MIMLLELGERFPQRSFPEQDQVGQALLFDRPHPAFRKSVQVRTARRESQTLHAPCCQKPHITSTIPSQEGFGHRFFRPCSYFRMARYSLGTLPPEFETRNCLSVMVGIIGSVVASGQVWRRTPLLRCDSSGREPE